MCFKIFLILSDWGWILQGVHTQTQRVGDSAHRGRGLLDNRSAIPSPFLRFLPGAPAPSVTCPLSCTPRRLHVPGTACHSHIPFSTEERHPAYMLFLSLLSLQGVCLTDAYKLITCIFPVLQITQDMLAFCYFFLLFPLSGISFPLWWPQLLSSPSLPSP